MHCRMYGRNLILIPLREMLSFLLDEYQVHLWSLGIRTDLVGDEITQEIWRINTGCGKNKLKAFFNALDFGKVCNLE